MACLAFLSSRLLGGGNDDCESIARSNPSRTTKPLWIVRRKVSLSRVNLGSIAHFALAVVVENFSRWRLGMDAAWSIGVCEQVLKGKESTL